jgi:hypothetical protein
LVRAVSRLDEADIATGAWVGFDCKILKARDTFNAGSISTGANQSRAADVGTLWYTNTSVHSISSGKLVTNGVPNTADYFTFGDVDSAEQFAREAGLTYLWEISTVTTLPAGVGCQASATADASAGDRTRFQGNTNLSLIVNGATSAIITIPAGARSYALVLLNEGMYALVKDSAGVVKLVFVTHIGSADRFALYHPGGSNANLQFDLIEVKGNPRFLSSPFANAAFRDTNPTPGEVFVGLADGVFSAAVTVPADPDADEEVAVYDVRRLDADNTLRLVLQRNATDDNYDVHLYKVESGTPTQIGSTLSGVGTAPARIFIRAEGSALQWGTENSSGVTTARTTATDATHASNTGASIDGTATLGLVDCFPIEHAYWDEVYNNPFLA